MHRYKMSVIAGSIVLSLLSSGAAAQQVCTVVPLAVDAPARPEALNEALACLQERLLRLEQQGSRPAAAPAAPPSPSDTPSQVQAFEFEDLRISLEHASVSDGKAVLLEMMIENVGDKPKLAIIQAQHGTVVSIRGVASPPRVVVQGFSVCPTDNNVTGDRVANCVLIAKSDANWTTLEPGRPANFNVMTAPTAGGIKSETASLTLRLIVKDQKGPRSKDISFSRIALAK